MPYGVGIDLGTSFTSVAIHGPDGTRMVSLSTEVVVPSVVYASPDGTLLTGAAAENAARVGGEPGRVGRGFKRRLGDPTPLVLGGAAYSPAALMAAQLRDVLAHVTRVEGEPPESVVLTCPAIWGPYRREHFAEVPRLAEVPASQLITEPEAAAMHYSVERTLGDGEVVAVYDLGGGTFDTTILRMRSGAMEILGTPEGIEHLGGIDFDETLLAHVDDRLDGAVSALDRADPVASAALAEIRAMCVRAKEELSSEPDVELSVPLPSGPRPLTITRLQLNDMIRPSVRLTTDGLRRTIASAGLRTEDLSAILLAGGSSRIPLVQQFVHDEFGKPVRATLHPKFTVALGAAARSARTAPLSPPSGFPAASPPAGFPAAAPPPESGEPRPSRGRRRRWVVPAAVAAVAGLVATTVLMATGDPDPRETAAGAGTTSSSSPETTSETSAPPLGPPAGDTATPPTRTGPASSAPAPLWLYDSGPVPPFHSLISSATNNWTAVDFGTAGARQDLIAAVPDNAGGVRVTWTGGAPAQVYLQNVADARDLTSFVGNGGALVFDTVVHSAPAERTAVAVHCIFPCASEVDATTVFRDLPVGEKATVKIPISCFTAKGLNAAMVNTPFLVYTTGAFDATFSDIRWETDVPDATPCSAVP